MEVDVFGAALRGEHSRVLSSLIGEAQLILNQYITCFPHSATPPLRNKLDKHCFMKHEARDANNHS